MNYRIIAPRRIEGEIDLPASKSISNRVLLLNALCATPGRLSNLAQCDDTDAVLSALAQPDASEVNIGAAGTAMRFLTAYFATREGREVVIDGTERMRQRPIGVLVDALRQLGADIEYVEAEGYPPLKITGTRLHGGALTVSGSVSSQYITAILLIAPVIGGITLTIEGEIMSRPYIDMTLALMARYGVKAEWRENVIHVPAGEYTALDFTVEADWSAASYWWAMQAIVPQSRISLKGLEPQSLQGDSRIAELMSQMGVTGNWCGRYLDLRSNGGVGCCCSTFADLSGTPDIAQTLVVMLCLMGRPFRITGLRTLRIKETDRLEALRTELRKLGYVVKVEGDDAISWHFETTAAEASPHICTYHDHRMAMAFAPAAIRFPGLIIDDAQVVSKSYPLFWEHLRQAGFKIEEV
ncbi:MAG: 3-phosphoshikimate 1-carboxyvinyltransferase [Sodaliphilus sp.]|nr:3-phosphoshikimate 1-carboxyvinyltransferase [Bacteroidales bacterium]MDY3076546.1 3-phosphoshikimate 1-carboxyvinyltransferase [Sodaliphilus sp.]MCI6984726.1 3-phosphoshikimate 1-carboxyvinyltransferase [Bacteroidales bacterium]MDD7136826.1 3-phosphoshikimate 1-carboxyvinyltransferase [Bacteroidales bacterium]MDD7191945.1 3-phosphoshikimate 1-carboxyvinyltransferase [Bacteroidales bacterium]